MMRRGGRRGSYEQDALQDELNGRGTRDLRVFDDGDDAANTTQPVGGRVQLDPAKLGAKSGAVVRDGGAYGSGLGGGGGVSVGGPQALARGAGAGRMSGLLDRGSAAGGGYSPDEYQRHFSEGTAAGQDMSWMQQQGLVPSGGASGSGAGQFARSGFGGMNLDMGAGGNVNPMNFSGFNLDRAFAGGDADSVKDGFARTVAGLNLDLRGLDKPAVGDALRSQVIPALNANGIQARMSPDSYDVIEVFSAERGWEPIDVVQNAGSGDAAWAWQDQLGQGGAGGGMGFGMGGGIDDALNGALAGMGGTSLLDQIMAELQAAMQGRSSPSSQAALQQGLESL